MFFWGGDKVVKLVGGGSVINGATPFSLFTGCCAKNLTELVYCKVV